MGNCQFKTDNINDQQKSVVLQKNHFIFLYCIGKGGFGKVWKVVMKKNNQYYAMKEMAKARIISKRSVDSVLNERQILSEVKHQFLVNMYFAFQDRENLYLCMDLLPGGDLRYHINKRRKFTEEQTKFIVACLLQAFDYIHKKNIIHRDIKPENIVLDSDGYLRLTDFGIARYYKKDNAKETSGTPSYMAPEVLCKQNHTFAVDYYALGVIAYECMMGKRPYSGKSRQEIRDQILQRQVQIREQEVPQGWSLEAADFINKLIQRKCYRRLGYYGINEVRRQPWLKDYNWEALNNKQIPAPFIPPGEDNFSQKVVTEAFRDENEEKFKESIQLLEKPKIQSMFDGYYYDYQQAIAMRQSNGSSDKQNDKSMNNEIHEEGQSYIALKT